MQTIFTLYRKKGTAVGHTIEYEGNLHIVTHILGMKKSEEYPGYLEITAVLQQVGTETYYDEYDDPFITIDMRYDLTCEGPEDIDRVGWVREVDGECMQITDILSVRYDRGYLIVDYEYTLIEPWSDEKIDEFVKANRRVKFDVIEGQKKDE